MQYHSPGISPFLLAAKFSASFDNVWGRTSAWYSFYFSNGKFLWPRPLHLSQSAPSAICKDSEKPHSCPSLSRSVYAHWTVLCLNFSKSLLISIDIWQSQTSWLFFSIWETEEEIPNFSLSSLDSSFCTSPMSHWRLSLVFCSSLSKTENIIPIKC